MQKPTLSEQRTAVEELLYHAKGRIESGGATEAAVRAAILTLAWIERRAELGREVDRLDKAAPEILAVLKEFPEARLTGAK